MRTKPILISYLVIIYYLGLNYMLLSYLLAINISEVYIHIHVYGYIKLLLLPPRNAVQYLVVLWIA